MKFFATIILVFFCSLFITVAQSDSARDAEKRILDNILDPAKYDKRIRPIADNSSDTNGPVKSEINFFIRQIESLNDDKPEIRLQLTFRLQWKDPRLEFQPVPDLDYINIRDPSALWVPDVFFSNERSSTRAGALHPSTLVRIYPDGKVLFSSVLTLTLSCPHEYSRYPFDRPECPIKIASYGYTTKDLVLTWKEEQPIQLTRKTGSPTLSVVSTKTEYCTSRTNTGEYSCLHGSIILKRISSEHMLRTYPPTTLLVLVSYLAFWVKKPNHRLLIALLTLLVFTVDATLSQTTRPAHSVTAIDVWFGVCITFVLITLILVVVLNSYENQPDSNGQVVAVNDVEGASQKEQLVEDKAPQAQTVSLQERLKKLRQINIRDSNKLLVLIRAFYPLAFGIFALLYSVCFCLL